MANCPVQLIMNSSEYFEEDARPKGRGNNKDYYAGRDQEFVTHKERFIEQLDLFESVQKMCPYTQIAYAKIKLHSKAYAKTNRPTEKLLTTDNGCKIVGSNKRGEMLVRFGSKSVEKIKAAAIMAEDSVELVMNKKNNRMEPKPTRIRSELGAVQDIMPILAEDRSSLTAGDIVSFIHKHGQGYIYVELFETPKSTDLLEGDDSVDAKKMFHSFIDGLSQITGIRVYRSGLGTSQKRFVLYISEDKNIKVHLNESILKSSDPVLKASTNLADYVGLLNFLTSHPVVRRVMMSPIVQSVPTPSFKYDSTQKASIPKPGDKNKYPIIGIADTGVSDILEDWLEARVDNINPQYKDASHGTFIGGLYITGKVLNPSFMKEGDGNRLVEICVLPEENSFFQVYPKGLDEFLMNLEYSIVEAVESTNVRIIGLSMNIESARIEEEYSPFASELDKIAIENNVILVISAGNLIVRHKDWNEIDEDANIAEFKSRNDDIVYSPAESIRNISVGALNPPDNWGLSNYTCLGRGLSTSTKPDMVHVGGFGSCIPNIGTGLYSISLDGYIITACGTSYAAPMVAKTMAAVDYMTNSSLPRETIMALTIHNSSIPEAFRKKKYKPFLKDWIGFGVPADSEKILNGTEHSISLVFHQKIRKGQVYKFPFNWPASLIQDGKCRGRIKLTMVSTPRLDYDYNAELVREDITVSLHQVDEEGRSLGSKLKPVYHVSNNNSVARNEVERIDGYYKWHPIKVYEVAFKKGYEANNGPWVLEARIQERDDDAFVGSEVAFTIILTLEDPEGEAYVYNEMRQELQMAGVQISDIQTAVKIQPRV